MIMWRKFRTFAGGSKRERGREARGQRKSINMADRTKTRGQIFTPPQLAGVILDYCGYTAGNILRRHVIDNSCGDGAFLVEIVRRYMADFLSQSDDREALRGELATYVHGIELERDTWRQCIDNLDAAAGGNVEWDVRCADALAVGDYDGRMDFVVGNPPYVRVHNLDNYDDVKRYSFAASGMIDLYIVFFELGFHMLKPDGRMCIITPSSWLGSKAAAIMRGYVLRRGNLSGLIDLGHYQPFAGATTYTLISRFEGGKAAEIDYQTYDGSLHPVDTLTLSDMLIDGTFYLSARHALEELRQVRESINPRRAVVKNGFATLADSVFIGQDLPQEDCVIDIVKASTGKWSRCVFPYDKQGKPYTLEQLEKLFPATYKYMLAKKEKLCSRDADSGQWHLFGRSQAIGDVRREKIAINSLLRTADDIKLCRAGKGKGVYSGLYILTPLPFETVREIVCSKEFASYVAMLKNYKSGGYYTFSSRDLELFINYKLSFYEYGQLKVS